MLADIPRKSLPAIAKAVGLPNEQVLHHFLTESPWKVEALRKQRLSLILEQLQGRSITLIIDETGDRKKGKSTDYVDRQYIGNLGKIDNGIVSVNAYGVLKGLTFPLIFKVFKPKKRLKAEDIYQTLIQLAQEIIQELQVFGFKFELVLADSLYGESHPFVRLLDELQYPWIMAIRSNHGVLMPQSALEPTVVRLSTGFSVMARVRFAIFKKLFSVNVVIGVIGQLRLALVQLPENSTWYVMSYLPKPLDKEVGIFIWIENLG